MLPCPLGLNGESGVCECIKLGLLTAGWWGRLEYCLQYRIWPYWVACVGDSSSDEGEEEEVGPRRVTCRHECHESSVSAASCGLVGVAPLLQKLH